MNQIMKFENTPVNIQIINGVPMFELYSVGMALGQVRYAKGKAYPRKDRIDQNAENAEFKPVVHNGQLYITESQLYDLMLEMRTDKCRAFRKWITNEVLPTLNHTGYYSFEQLSFEDEPEYEYIDKTYHGTPVLTIEDISHITGVKRSNIRWHLVNKCVRNEDYCVLHGQKSIETLAKENPKFTKKITHLSIVAKSGFVKLCESMGIKCEIPTCYCIEEKKKSSDDILDRILEDFCIRKGYLTEENRNILLGNDTTITGNSVLMHNNNGNKIFYDHSADYYEKFAVLAKNIGQLLLGCFRESIDGKPICTNEINEEARVFSATFLALKLFADYGGFDTKK